MQLLKALNTPAGQTLIIASVGVGVYYLLKKEVSSAGQAVNPLNNDNIFYSGANALGASLTGQENFNLGHYIYDLTH